MFAVSLLMLALLAHSVHGTYYHERAATLEDVALLGGRCGQLGKGVLNLEAAISCLSTLSITAEAVYHTITHVKHGVLGLYSFTEIARNSWNSSEAQTAGCNFSVHHVEVDLEGSLGELEKEIMTAMRVQDMEQLRTFPPSSGSLRAYLFHERLAAIFRKLQDGHTIYLPPYVGNPGVMEGYHYVQEKASEAPLLRLGVVASRKISDLVQAGAGLEELVDVVILPQAAGWPGNHRVQDITKVTRVTSYHRDGSSKVWSPFEWLVHQADGIGVSKSRGVRLNMYLNSFRSGVFLCHTYPLPDHTMLKLELVNGEVRHYLTMVGFGTLDMQRVQRAMDYNPRWTGVKAWLDAAFVTDSSSPTQAKRRLQGLQQRSASQRQHLLHASPRSASPAPEILYAAPLRTQVYPEQPDSTRLTQDWDKAVAEKVQEMARWPALDPMVIIYRIPSHQTGVYKVTTLMPPEGETPVTAAGQIIKLYQRLWKTIEKLGGKRVILDLADNGGGAVSLANLLAMLFAPRHGSGARLCTSYAIRVNNFWRDWLESFAGKWHELYQKSQDMDAATVVAHFERLQVLPELGNITEVPVPFTIELRDLINRVKATANLEEQKQMILNVYANPKLYFQPNFIEGWFPFDDGVINPTDGKSFSPPLAPYQNLEQRMWGGEVQNYTSNFILACTREVKSLLAVNSVMRLQSAYSAMHQWKEIAILSNGMCGSACALLLSRLQFSEGATVFTYGGIPGEKLDSTSFAGGSVTKYAEFWPSVLYAAALGDALHGPETPIGKRLRQAGVRRSHFGDVLPLPLPIDTARASFNFNMMFVKELGAQALPREWYIMPGHKHFWEWIQTSLRNDETWRPLQVLYLRIAEDKDWQALRQGDPSSQCASPPPTKPWEGGWWDDMLDDNGRAGVVVTVLATLACCTCPCATLCCLFGVVCCIMKRSRKPPSIAVNEATAPTVELQHPLLVSAAGVQPAATGMLTLPTPELEAAPAVAWVAGGESQRLVFISPVPPAQQQIYQQA